MMSLLYREMDQVDGESIGREKGCGIVVVEKELVCLGSEFETLVPER
jgi:hypothetical protein